MDDRLVAATRELPADVTRMLEEFVDAARTAFGNALHGVVLYGSAAEGALRASSDVNLLVVLERFERAAADRLREPAAVARAAVRLTPMFLLREEIRDASEAFAQKFADILRRRRVLYGDDPFAGVAIPRAALWRRLDQVLLNLTLRLRAAYVERGQYEEQLLRVIADASAPLRTSAASLLDLDGRAAASPKAALHALAAELGGGWDVLLTRMSDARDRRELAPEAASETVLGLIELARLMRARVRALERR
jgi:predicted nucleotidyltransferase